jgi:DNA-binding response OmpR family regulator
VTARILAADDDEHVRILVETKLSDEYDVETVADGSSAWESLMDSASIRPALVILDVMMPEMDGFETLKRIRNHDELADLPVILLTSRGREADVVRALELGADDFVTKPFSPAELKGRVTRLLG